jgi:hypothetical protein
MLKLWKGMFYCMFLSDKALVQVRLWPFVRAA